MKKKILHICHALYGRNNGLDTYVYNQVKINELDHVIIVPIGKNKSNLDKVIGIDSLAKIKEIADLMKIDIINIHYTGPECMSDIKDTSKFSEINGQLIKLSSEKNNLDFHPYSFVNIFSLFHPEDKNRPTIFITVHSEWKLPDYLAYPNIDGLIHVSKKTYEVNKNIVTNHFLIYPPVEERFFNHVPMNQIAWPEGFPVQVGWLGRLNKIDKRAYEITKKLYGNNDKICFHFAGDGKPDAEAPENFLFMGNQEPLNFLMYMDVFFYPSRIDSFSISLLEAQALGLPCVASEVVNELIMLNDGTTIDLEATDKDLTSQIKAN